MKINLWLFFACVLLTGCRSEPKEFSYTFIMESIDAYKLTLTIDHRRQFTIEEQNFFFDRHANHYNPVRKEGNMNKTDFKEFKKLLTNSNLFEMLDDYGFDVEEDQALHDIIYQIHYKTDGQDKFISIRLDDSTQFPGAFIKLIEYTNSFINKNK